MYVTNDLPPIYILLPPKSNGDWPLDVLESGDRMGVRDVPLIVDADEDATHLDSPFCRLAVWLHGDHHRNCLDALSLIQTEIKFQLNKGNEVSSVRRKDGQ